MLSYTRVFCLLLFSVACIQLQAQNEELTISRQVTATTTQSSAPDDGTHLQFSAHVGEVLIGTSAGSLVATQGFQQPHTDGTTAVIEIDGRNFDLLYFPNPTHEFLTVNLDGAAADLLQLQLVDLLGRTVRKQAIERNQRQASWHDLNDLPGGSYSLLALDRFGRNHQLGLIMISD
ncbi:MAG: T9SS type A sorting domain-containing protein [Bacteroidota bacterium]